MNTELLDLPWHIQVALAGGFAGYAIAYTGIRSHHKTIEIAFGSLVFSVIVTAVLNALLQNRLANEFWSSAGAILAALLAGLIWRVVLRRAVRSMLRQLQVLADDDPSAWKRLFDEPGLLNCQIAVERTDGSWVRCDDVSKFSGAPFWPFVLGEAGDILLYATHTKDQDGNVKEAPTTRDADWGDRVTYIPSGQIRSINIRHKRK